MKYLQIMKKLGIVGSYFEELLPKVEIIACTDLTILITGETGTGKELIAKSIHHLSNRRDKSLRFLNVTAINEGLFESELFGHEKGAFTDAHKSRDGVVREAGDGTIVLDEIGDLSLSAQVKLLRFIECGEIKSVGSDKTITTNIHIIASTNQDLDTLVKNGKFRLDLYERISALTIKLRPLRENTDTILDLAEHFIQKNKEKFRIPDGDTVTISGSDKHDLFLMLKKKM